MAGADGPDSIWSKAGGAFWTGLPIASALAFVAAAIKVFRAARMETSTTVAIIGSADDVQLLKGVLVSLLPGFIVGVIALSVWVWAHDLPAQEPTQAQKHEALGGPRALVMLALVLVGAFTVSVVAWLPMVAVTGGLYIAVACRRARKEEGRAEQPVTEAAPAAEAAETMAATEEKPITETKAAAETKAATEDKIEFFTKTRAVVVFLALVSALGSVLFLALSTDVWLPLRDVKLVSGQSVVVGTQTISREMRAYILSQDDKTTTLLLDSPRAVVTVPTAELQPDPMICVPSRRGAFWLLRRPTQAVHVDGRFPTPYAQCPPTS